MSKSLTDRDLALFEELRHFGFLSFQQIQSSFFSGRTKATTHNRLTLLERKGYLKRVRIGRVFHHLENRDIGVVFQATRSALKCLHLVRPQLLYKTDPIAINTHELLHDLILTDVLKALKIRFCDENFLGAKTLETTFLPKGRVPDAVILNGDRKVKLAIELEITAKSEKRYRQILTSYRVHPCIEKVLYITGAKAIDEKIQGILDHKPSPGLAKPMTGKFYFLDFKELLSNPKETNASNGREFLNLAVESSFKNLKKEAS